MLTIGLEKMNNSERYKWERYRNENINMNKDLIDMIVNGVCTLASSKNGEVYQASGMGVKPIITPMRDNRIFFEGADVADTVIGKAGALLLVLSGVKTVYGQLMSESAINVLQKYNIPYQYENIVPFIENRDRNGMCPLEDSVKDEEDPTIAFEKIEARIKILMRGK